MILFFKKVCKSNFFSESMDLRIMKIGIKNASFLKVQESTVEYKCKKPVSLLTHRFNLYFKHYIFSVGYVKLMLSLFTDETLSLNSSHTTTSGSCNSLTVSMVLYITSCKYTGYIGAGTTGNGIDISCFVHI